MDEAATPPKVTPTDLDRALHVLAWLEEERHRDKEEIQRLAQAAEQVMVRTREAFSRLEVAEAELRVLRAQSGRGSQVEDAVRQLREGLAAIQEWQEGHERLSARTSQTLAVAAERDRRTLAELQSQIADLVRETDSLKARVALVGDEVRRDASSLVPVQQETEALLKRVEAIEKRQDLGDDAQRHREVKVTELTQQVERLSTEVGRFTDWQRLAEIRWQRQLSEWQQQLDTWRFQVEESVAAVNSAVKQMPAIRDEIAEIRRLLSEERERWAEQAKALVQVSAQQETDRDVVAQVEMSVTALQTRADQLLTRAAELTTALDRMSEQQAALEARLRADKERLEGAHRTLARLEQRDESLEARIEDLVHELAAFRREHRDALAEAARTAAEQRRQLDARIVLLEQLQEEHKVREISELEQQLRELQDRVRQAKT